MIERLLQFLIYLLQLWQNRESLKTLGAVRSSEWRRIRNEFLQEYPECFVCKRKENLIVHHQKPFHLFKELELEKSNLVSLCESAGMNCHITYGHLGNFKSYNPEVKNDLLIWRKKVEERPL